MNEYLTDSVILATLILCSAYFSATETAFTSFNKIKLKNLASKGSRRAALALRLADDYDRLLSTILIGNNIVNIGAASFATVIFTRLYGHMGATIATVSVTIVVLIFGEITPKCLAKDMPEKFSMFSAPIINLLLLLLKPVNYLFGLWKKTLNRLIKVEDGHSITEEEILTLVEEAEEDGGIDPQAGELIRSAIEFDDQDVIDICTPRIRLVAVDEKAQPAEVKKLFNEHGYSRLPVYRQGIDDIVGVINQKDFYNLVLDGGKTLGEVMTPILYVNPGMKVSALMRMLQQKRTHIALIIDEYGGTLGVVTLEDIIEELIGEIWDEHDRVVHEFEPLSSREFRVLGSAGLDGFFDQFHLRGEEVDSSSVNGWLIGRFERIPRVGDKLEFQGLTIEVLDATERRIVAVKVTLPET